MDKTDVKQLLEIIKIHQEMIRDISKQMTSFIDKQMEVNKKTAELMEAIRKLAMMGSKDPIIW